jgi:hypothetical protein
MAAHSVLFFRDIPADLKSQFKAYCARRDKTMTEVIVRLMAECVANDNTVQIRDHAKRKGRRKGI